MSEPLPETIAVREEADRIRYVLPRRSMGLFGAIPFIIGIPMVGITLGVDWIKVREVWWGWWLIMAFRMGGSIAILVGIQAVLGTTVIEVSRGRLRAASKVFGIGWWRSRPVSQITRVEAVRTPVEMNGRTATPGFVTTMATLEAFGQKRKRFRLCSFYDLRLLAPLASELNRRLHR